MSALLPDADVRLALISRLQRCEMIDDPVLGAVTVAAFSASSMLWPGHGWAAIVQIATTIGEDRRVDEYVFTPRAAGTSMPVAIVYDGSDQARIYAAHELTPARAPLLPIDPAIASAAADGFLAGYFAHLRGGDLEASIAMFETDGYIQHSNGARYQGAESIRADYAHMFKANGGSIDVRFANVMDDGQRRVFECIMPSGRPAVAVYQRGVGGRIAAVRISL